MYYIYVLLIKIYLSVYKVGKLVLQVQGYIVTNYLYFCYIIPKKGENTILHYNRSVNYFKCRSCRSKESNCFFFYLFVKRVI